MSVQQCDPKPMADGRDERWPLDTAVRHPCDAECPLSVGSGGLNGFIPAIQFDGGSGNRRLRDCIDHNSLDRAALRECRNGHKH
jgi:hypothetical protein